ncbi:MAG: hypothetical protein ACI8W7_000563 [Gammaproteobacteria bacterium]|jgi:hypothetical protein
MAMSRNSNATTVHQLACRLAKLIKIAAHASPLVKIFLNRQRTVIFVAPAAYRQ